MQFNEDLPKWEAVGSAPPETLQNTGFVAGYKPPAAFFNWLFNRIYKSIKELRGKTEEIGRVIDVTLTVNGWLAEGDFYKQEVAVFGIKADDNPTLVKRIDKIIQNNDRLVKAYEKNFSFIFDGDTKNSSVIFYAYKKPGTDIKVGLKGV